MKKQKIVLILLTTVVLVYCASNLSTEKMNSITIEKGACMTNCPIYKISINTNGEITFKGIKNTNYNGTITFIDKNKTKTLYQLFEQTDFYELKEYYQPRLYDYPETTISYNTKKVTLKQYDKIPLNLRIFLIELDQIIEQKHWIE